MSGADARVASVVARKASVSGRAASGARSAGAKRPVIPQLGWRDARPEPVVLVSGAEALLADRAMRSVRDTMRAQDASVEVTDIRAGEYAPGELLTLASPSLFGEPRLIRVEGVEKCTDDFITETLGYLESPADDTCLVLRHAGGVRGKKLLDAVRGGLGGGIEVVCAELKKDSDKYDFAQAEFRAAGKNITPGALRAVTSAFADDLAELAAACQQLISDTGEQITEATVDKYYGGRVEATAFKVADAAIAGQHGEALITLRHALTSGSDPVPMVAAFASKVRTMTRVYGSHGSAAQLASEHGLAPWQVDRARRDLRGWSEAGLARCIQALAEADANVKGGGRDPVFALEKLIELVSRHGVDTETAPARR
jgi:DNA polymerase III subunit delta